MTGLPIFEQLPATSSGKDLYIIGISEHVNPSMVKMVEQVLIDKNVNFLYAEPVQQALLAIIPDNLKWEDRDAFYNFDSNLEVISYVAQKIGKLNSIVDMGAGAMHLKKFLPENVIYTPVDYKQRYPQTVVCDFNNNEFPNIHADVYFCCAMLYYIEQPVDFLVKVSKYAKSIVIVLHSESHISENINSNLLTDQTKKNNLHFDEITKILSTAGFMLLNRELIPHMRHREYAIYQQR